MKQTIKNRIKNTNGGIVPAGYKRTAFGVFPNDWDESNISDLCEVYSGGTPDTKIDAYWNGDIPWCVPTDITASNKYISRTEKRISKLGLENSSAMLMPCGSILMCSRATIGPRCINTVPMATNQGFKNLICKDSSDTEFVYYLLEHLTDSFVKRSNGSTFLELSKSELENSKYIIPTSGKERSRISEILMKWDEAIELYEQLIEKYKQRKAIFLQKMFPSKGKDVPEWRFKGFTTPWEQRKLGDATIEILAGGDIDKSKVVGNGKYPIYANALTNDGIVGYYDDYYRVKAPAVTVTGRGEVGFAQARMVDFTPVVRLLAIRSNHDCYFLENAINNHKVIVESTGVPQLTVPQLSSYYIFFPKNTEEESKIGKYFRRLDNLITLHQRKLDTLKKQRKALQQYLLTGIVRVKI